VITGTSGYLGGPLAERLSGEGHALRLVSRSLRPSVTASAQLRHEYRAADLRDPESWLQLLRGADAVVHLSWRTDLRAAEVDPAADEEINVGPVRALVETAGAMKTVPIVVFVSAATIVGANPKLPVDDTARDNPCSVYDRHKLAGEIILREGTACGSVRACSLRLANVYGYGGASINANRGILNIMMKRAIAGEPLTLYGNGAYTRDFIHIDDVIEALVAAILTPTMCDGGHYLIASGRGHTLAEAYAAIAEVALERLRRRVEIVRVAEPADLHAIEKRNFIGDSRAFRARTNWRPRLDLRAGIDDYFVRAAQPAMTH
jgi:UDP-glucose 4-epimerase